MIQEAVFVYVFPIVDAQERKSSDRPYNYQQRINAYDTVLNAVEAGGPTFKVVLECKKKVS